MIAVSGCTLAAVIKSSDIAGSASNQLTSVGARVVYTSSQCAFVRSVRDAAT